jgi:hypothetical protein
MQLFLEDRTNAKIIDNYASLSNKLCIFSERRCDVVLLASAFMHDVDWINVRLEKNRRSAIVFRARPVDATE